MSHNADNQPKTQLLALSQALGLKNETQDWGIINADANRVVEFIDFFNTHSDLSPPMQYQMFELIVGSYNEVLIEGHAQDTLRIQFFSFLQQNGSHQGLNSILSYWRDLDDDEEFPVSKELRARV